MMQLSRRQITGLAIAIGVLILLTILVAPQGGGNQRQRGSTYSRSPDGYGAWFAYLEQVKIPVQRWRKPITLLTNPDSKTAEEYTANGKSPQPKGPITLLQISNGVDQPRPLSNWVKTGNVQIILGSRPTTVTKAPFTTDLPSRFGRIRIQTSRRHQLAPDQSQPNAESALLEDSFGAVIWQQKVGKGRIIYASTPYLAANAYQDFQGNYELLADLVKGTQLPLWIDEFSHGYTDAPPQTAPGKPAPRPNVLSYLWSTPLSLVGLQLLIVLGVLLWGQNRRFGSPQPVLAPSVDNSAAYIQAMAGVLHKARCSAFVVTTVGKAEQLAIQKALGLGATPLPLETLATAWEQQTGRSPADLTTILTAAQGDRRLSEAELQTWIQTIQTLRSQLP